MRFNLALALAVGAILAWSTPGLAGGDLRVGTVNFGDKRIDDIIAPGDASQSSPALVEFNGKLFIAWAGLDTQYHIVIGQVNPETNTIEGKITLNAKSYITNLSSVDAPADPALAVIGGSLYIAWTGPDRRLHLGYFQDVPHIKQNREFAGQFTFSDKVSVASPSLAVWAPAGVPPRLFVAWYSATDLGTDMHVGWFNPSTRKIENVAQRGLSPMLNTRPALAVVNDRLVMAWAGSDGKLQFGQVDQATKKIVDIVTLFEASSRSAPTLASLDPDQLYVAWIGADRRLWVGYFNGVPHPQTNKKLANKFKVPGETSFELWYEGSWAAPALTFFKGIPMVGLAQSHPGHRQLRIHLATKTLEVCKVDVDSVKAYPEDKRLYVIDLFNTVYPEIVRFYGEPSANQTVKIHHLVGKDSSMYLSHKVDVFGDIDLLGPILGGLVDGILATLEFICGLALGEIPDHILFLSLVPPDPDSAKADAHFDKHFTHEIIHSWHDAQKLIGWYTVSWVEEGMTEAAAELVAEELHKRGGRDLREDGVGNAPWQNLKRYDMWSSNSSSLGGMSLFAGLGGSEGGRVIPSSTIRYGAAAALWLILTSALSSESYSNNFLRMFNHELYRQDVRDAESEGFRDALKTIAGDARIDGLPVLEWLRKQPITETFATQPALFVDVNDPENPISITIYGFSRDQSSLHKVLDEEKPLEAPIEVKISDAHGTVICSTKTQLGSDGHINLGLNTAALPCSTWPLPAGGYKVYVRDTGFGATIETATFAISLGGSAGSMVEANQGWRLISFLSNERYVDDNGNNGNNAYDPGESIYRDKDGDGFVSVGDELLMGGQKALRTPLKDFASRVKHTENIKANGAYDPQEWIFFDSDDNGYVTASDRRLTDQKSRIESEDTGLYGVTSFFGPPGRYPTLDWNVADTSLIGRKDGPTGGELPVTHYRNASGTGGAFRVGQATTSTYVEQEGRIGENRGALFTKPNLIYPYARIVRVDVHPDFQITIDPDFGRTKPGGSTQAAVKVTTFTKQPAFVRLTVAAQCCPPPGIKVQFDKFDRTPETTLVELENGQPKTIPNLVVSVDKSVDPATVPSEILINVTGVGSGGYIDGLARGAIYTLRVSRPVALSVNSVEVVSGSTPIELKNVAMELTIAKTAESLIKCTQEVKREDKGNDKLITFKTPSKCDLDDQGIEIKVNAAKTHKKNPNSSNDSHKFVNWEINNNPNSRAGQLELKFHLTENKTLTARYTLIGKVTLTVLATIEGHVIPLPISMPMTITTPAGKESKETLFEVLVDKGTSVKLEAPTKFRLKDSTAVFMRWEMDDDQVLTRENVVLRSWDRNAVLFARYQPAPKVGLAVQAVTEALITAGTYLKLINVPIKMTTPSGTASKETPFNEKLEQETKVTLEAPREYELGDQTLVFVDWTIDERRSESKPVIALTVNDFTTVRARYRPPAAPVIHEFQLDPQIADPGQEVTITVITTDLDEDIKQVTIEATSLGLGTFNANRQDDDTFQAVLKLKRPLQAKTYPINISASDVLGNSSLRVSKNLEVRNVTPAIESIIVDPATVKVGDGKQVKVIAVIGDDNGFGDIEKVTIDAQPAGGNVFTFTGEQLVRLSDRTVQVISLSFNHTDQAGTFTITAFGEDGKGNRSESKSVTLVVEVARATLTVDATIDGSSISIIVPIAVTTPTGTSTRNTPFTLTLDHGTAVTLEAPSQQSGLKFKEWREGSSSFSAQARVAFNLNQNRKLVAVYQRIGTVNVSAICEGCATSPTAIAVSISLNGVSGTTPFSREVNPGSTVTVSAPSSVTISGRTLNFQRWEQDGRTVSSSTNYSFTATGSTNLRAVYAPPPPTLTVTLSVNATCEGCATGPIGINGVPVSVNGVPGSTPFSRTVNQNSAVTVSAPGSYTVSGQTVNFQRWEQDGRVVSSSSSYSFTATANTTLRAVYTRGGGPPGGSCCTLQFKAFLENNGRTEANVPITVNGVPRTTPFSVTLALNAAITMQAQATVRTGDVTWDFDHWESDGQFLSNSNPLSGRVDKNETIVVVYKPRGVTPMYVLTVRAVNISNSGASISTSVPVRVTTPSGTSDQNTQFSMNIPSGTSVTLRILQPDTGTQCGPPGTAGTPTWKFDRWTGAVNSTDQQVTLTIYANTTITAEYRCRL
jgi:hypothetical protein